MYTHQHTTRVPDNGGCGQLLISAHHAKNNVQLAPIQTMVAAATANNDYSSDTFSAAF